jgi:hypothetical protein
LRLTRVLFSCLTEDMGWRPTTPGRKEALHQRGRRCTGIGRRSGSAHRPSACESSVRQRLECPGGSGGGNRQARGSGPAGEHRACNIRQERYCALFCRRRGSSVEPDHKKWDPVTLKAAAGTCHVRRWIRDRDCSKALVRRHWGSGSLTPRCSRELEAMVAG